MLSFASSTGLSVSSSRFSLSPRSQRSACSGRQVWTCSTSVASHFGEGRDDRFFRPYAPERVVLRGTSHEASLLAATQDLGNVAEMHAQLRALRRHKLALLLADVSARARTHAPDHMGTEFLGLDTAAAALLSVDDHAEADDAARARARTALWHTRLALQNRDDVGTSSSMPCYRLRCALEAARSALLDVPVYEEGDRKERSEEERLKGEIYGLLVENTLLEELRSLRILGDEVDDAVEKAYPGFAKRERRAVAEAAAGLGIDDYRVRGKKKLVDAVCDLRKHLELQARERRLAKAVKICCETLHDALVRSLETDLSVRRPDGQAMLLRPAMHDIPNFALVDEHILRGGQPTERGIEWLADYGVTMFIDLRGSDRLNQWAEPPRNECVQRRIVGAHEEIDVKFCNLPIEDFGTPSFEQVSKFVRLVDEAARQKRVAYVHCKAGIGRTGVMVSCWRISKGASVEDALAKERLYSRDGGGLKQEHFVRDYARYFARQRNGTSD